MNTAAPDPSADSLHALAERLYIASTNNHPTIHCNRFPAWRELSNAAKREWLEKARNETACSNPESAPAAAVGGVVLTPAEEDAVAIASREQLLSERDEVLKDYVDDYEYLGEDADGQDGCYRPNERERILIEDAIRGWEALEVSMPTPAAPVGGFVVDALIADMAKTIEEHPDYGSLMMYAQGWLHELQRIAPPAGYPHGSMPADWQRGYMHGWNERGSASPAAQSSEFKLQAFKDYVRQRLDEAGIPTHPEGPHSAAGCRIGDRLDIALAQSSAKDGVRGDGVVIDESLARDLIEYAEKGKVAEPWMVKRLLEAHSAQATTGAGLVDGDKVLWGVVANAGRLSDERKPRWSHVSAATGQGSTSSAELCRRFGFDPDETVGREAAIGREVTK